MEAETISKNGTILKNNMHRFIYCIAISMLLFPKIISAQINLEHTFDGYIAHGNSHFYTHNYYATGVLSTNQVKIYKEDYTLYKTVSITPPEGYTASGSVLCLSKNIVTTDNKLSFFIVFQNGSAPQNQQSMIRLYDENGAIVKDFGYFHFIIGVSFHKTADNKFRLSIAKHIDGEHKTEIYSLPGTPPSSPTITTTTLPSGMVGVDYNAVLSATGDAPIVWSIETGSLPGGLNLSSEGVIDGIPTETETSSFTVKATNSVGNDTKELSIFIDEETGISMLQIEEMKIFPNPANNRLIIECENVNSKKIMLYDMIGNEVLNQNIHDKTEINISNLQKGIYIVSIVSENKVIGSFKIVKQ